MTRNEQIRELFDKSMRLIEIGPSYNPIIPRRDGWQTTIVDHASKADLIEKYGGNANVIDVTQVEDVDILWRDGPLHQAFAPTDHHTFDGLIASHVIEHMPDLIGFLQSVATLLKPSGIFFLAVPDKRLCFDFFQPLTTVGDALDGMGQSRHSRGALFDNHAYYVRRGSADAWASVTAGGRYAPFKLANPLADAGVYLTHQEAEYMDCHKWRFTPASFELLVLDLNVLGLIPWKISRIVPQAGIEFLVWLERGEITLSKDELDERRLHLLQETVMETQEQIRQIRPEPKSGIPSISAVVPLYNGRQFIEESVHSILQQTLPPIEIIVVDDGSTDDGPEIVKRMAQQYPITLLSKINGGQSSARNFGIEHSRGELIALLDQDDVWYPEHLAELVKPFTEPSTGRRLGWVYSNLDEIDTEGNMINHCFLRTLKTPHPKRDLFSCVQEDMFILPSASLILRSAFDKVNGFDVLLSGYEDDDLFLRLFRAGYDNVFLEMALSKWRIYPGSSSYSYRMRRSRAIYFRKLWDTFEDDPQRVRFIKRDLLIPRFYGHAVAEFLKAIRTGDSKTIQETREELLFVLSKIPEWKRRAFGQALAKLESPKMVDVAFAMRRYLRPIVRRFI